MTDKQPSSSSSLRAIILVLCLIIAGQGWFLWQAYAPSVSGGVAVRGGGEPEFDAPLELTEANLDKIVMKNCSLTPYEIDGTSLQPAYKDGTRHVFYMGDKCPIPALLKPGVVALLNTGAANKMVSKFVRGMPGDRIALARRAGRISVLTINGRDVRNSVGVIYSISRDRQALLQLYIENYDGLIPVDAYLLLGDDVNGSLDSTRFGLANIRDISGVMRVEEYAPVPVLVEEAPSEE